MQNLEYRLTSRGRQDRSVKTRIHARTTDKSNQAGWIYSLISCYNLMKHELTQMIPFLADSKVPASHIFLINENYLHLFAHKDENMKMMPFQMPINQNVRTAKIFFMGALGSSNNRLHGKLSAVAA